MKAHTKMTHGGNKMKKTNKFFLGGTLAILLLTPVSQVKADWRRDNVGWWYSLNDGDYYRDGEALINEKWYKFDDNGYMMTGWHLTEYKLLRGQLVQNWSYFDPVNGDKKLGWQNIDGKWYYLTSDGALKGMQQIDGKWYYFDPVNYDMQTGWVSTQGFNGTLWYYFDLESGERISGWKNIDGKWYYFDNYAVTNSRIIDGKSYYFDPVNCDMQTGWVAQHGVSTLWYYYDLKSGEQLSGWQNIDGKWYYLDQQGAYTDYNYIDGKYYYFDKNTCELKTGWLEFNGSKYYADPNDGGALASDKTLVIDGVSYSFNRDGSLIQN